MIFAAEVMSAVSQAECAALAELAEGLTVLEVGAHHGRSTIALASTAERVHSVDWFRGYPDEDGALVLAAIRQNLARHEVGDRVIQHIGSVSDVLPSLQSGFFDGIFIDGGHTLPEVVRDILLTRRLLRIHGSGGINLGRPSHGWLAFHDYGNDSCPGVAQALAGLPAYLGLRMRVVETLAILEP